MATVAGAQPRFVDVAAQTGVDTFGAVSSFGHDPAGIFADLNNDGYPDLYLVHNGANKLYINVPGVNPGERVYQEQVAAAGANDSGRGVGAIAGDYDNDGDVDLYVLNFSNNSGPASNPVNIGMNVLYRNELIETSLLGFTDVTVLTDPTPGIADSQFGVSHAIDVPNDIVLDNSLSASWFDPDRDGDLDLYVGNHDGWCGNPVWWEHDKPGQRDIFYINNGDGTFTDATATYGLWGWEDNAMNTENSSQRYGSSNAVVSADFNNDGWPDLLVTNKTECGTDRDMMYINNGEDVLGNWLGMTTDTYTMPNTFGNMSFGAMGVDVGDLDHDGDLDIYITDTSSSNPSVPGDNDLWLNQIANNGGTLDFDHSPILPGRFSWGTQIQDFDNNGWLDVHLVTRKAGSTWYRDYMYLVLASGVFELAEELGVAQVKNSFGDMSADYNLDGWVDLFVVNTDEVLNSGSEPPVLWENRLAPAVPNHHWLHLKLVGDPTLGGAHPSNVSAIGARVKVLADIDGNGVDDLMIREVVSGSSNAASTSSLALEFGLGTAVTASLVEITWPSGNVTSFVNTPVDLAVRINENGLVTLLP